MGRKNIKEEVFEEFFKLEKEWQELDEKLKGLQEKDVITITRLNYLSIKSSPSVDMFHFIGNAKSDRAYNYTIQQLRDLLECCQHDFSKTKDYIKENNLM